MKRFSKLFFDTASAAKEWFRKNYELQDQKWRQKQAEIAASNFQYKNEVISAQLQQDLFAVLQDYDSQHFDVNVPEDIHFEHYSVSPQGVLYSYLIYTPVPLNRTLLVLLRNSLKQKIHNDAQKLLLFYGYDDAFSFYPCIISGLYLMDITGDKNLLRLTVATNYQPF